MLRSTSWRSKLTAGVAGTFGLVVVSLTSVSYGTVVTVPYSQNFSSPPTEFTYINGTNGTWSETDGVSRLTLANQGAMQINAGWVQVNHGVGLGNGLLAGNLGSGQYFLISGTYKIDSYSATATGIDMGINIFGSANNFAGTQYRANFNPTTQKFEISGGSANFSASTPGDFTFSTADTYTLTVKGWYTGPALNLELTFLDPSFVGPLAVITATDTTPLSGVFFGFRDRTGSGAGNRNAVINHDDFSISIVPEPSSIFLVIVGLTGLLGMSVRARKK